VHTLPALTDAMLALDGDIQFDWLVEEAFAEIPSWHPAVKQVIPVAIRRWRKQPFKSFFSAQWKRFKQQLNESQYDYIIDAQGLLKSAWLTRLARGTSYGLDKYSAREPLASRFYQNTLGIEKNQHAVERVRQLFAAVLQYTLTDKIDYGIQQGIKESETVHSHQSPAVLFFHGTTWATKHWPENSWHQLAQQLVKNKCLVYLPWGSEAERLRAERIKQQVSDPQHIIILPAMSLTEIMHKLTEIDAVVSVDTGLAHLAAALDKPQITLFGPTNPGLTRPYGQNQHYLQVDYPCRTCMKKNCAKTEMDNSGNIIQPACFSSLSPETVMDKLQPLLGQYQ